MFDSPIFEVALGLTFVFLVLSLCATALVEGAGDWRQWRGRLLYRKLSDLLSPDLTGHLYADRRVTDLASGDVPKQWMAKIREWVPDRLARGRFTSFSKRDASRLAEQMGAGRLPSHIPGSVFADVVMDWLQGVHIPEGLHPASVKLEKLPDGVQLPLGVELSDIQPTEIPPRLADLWQKMNVRVDGDQDSLRQEIMRWFDTSMDRTSGQYKRRIKMALWFFGLLLVALLNADATRIAQTLYDDPSLRSRLVVAAEQVEATCDRASVDCAQLRISVNDALSNSIGESPFKGLIGWDSSSDYGWPVVLLGWLLTTSAITLGADFWFGALKRMVSLRSAKQDQSRPAMAVQSDPASPVPRHHVPRAPLDITNAKTSGLAGFQPHRFAESVIHAFWLAQFSSLAYLDPADLELSGVLHNHGLRKEFIEAGGTQLYVLEGEKLCIVAFRGTEQKLEDFLADADARQAEFWDTTLAGCSIHQGFRDALDDVWPQLQVVLAKATTPVWFTGHSLGGALASLASYRLAISNEFTRTIGGVYTYGQPRIGNDALAAACPKILAGRYFRFVNSSDIVPLVPPSVGLDYQHIGNFRYFDAAGRLHHERTLWERVAERLMPALQQVANGLEGWSDIALTHVRKRLADHGIARYVECLERVDVVRELWTREKT